MAVIPFITPYLFISYSLVLLELHIIYSPILYVCIFAPSLAQRHLGWFPGAILKRTVVRFKKRIMGSSHCCIFACSHLGSGAGHRTMTLASPLLLTNGPVRYEAVLYSCGQSQWGVLNCDSAHCYLTGTSAHQHHIMLSYSVSLS